MPYLRMVVSNTFFLLFLPLFGEMIPKFDKYFSKGLVQPPTTVVFFWESNNLDAKMYF